MQAAAQSEIGTVFASYSEAAEWIEGLSDDRAEAVAKRLGARPREGLDARLRAKGCLMPEYEDRFMSSAVVRSGSETIFDRDPKALRVVERVLGVVEQFSAGYAWVHHQEEVEEALRAARAFARYASSVETVEDFWSLARAMNRQNARYFDCWYEQIVEEALRDALEHEGVVDDGRTNHRSVYLEGFMTDAAYEDLIAREGRTRQSLDSAAAAFFRRFPRGTFDKEKARSHLEKTGSAYYFSDTNPHGREVVELAKPVHRDSWSKPISKGGDAASREAYEKFSREEAEAGYSVYGYWFGPDGAVHAMASFQAHDTWIRSTRDGGPGFPGGRLEALASGWVSMTMMNDYNPAANVAYRLGAGNERALKAAARMVRRGGDFSSAVVEAYEDDYRPAGFENFDDLKSAARRLNELACEVRVSSLRPT